MARGMRFRASIVFLAVQVVAVSAGAEPHARMTSYFTQKISQVKSVMGQETSVPPHRGGWVLNDINFDLSPQVSFGVSKVLNITVSPEINFVLTLEE